MGHKATDRGSRDPVACKLEVMSRSLLLSVIQ